MLLYSCLPTTQRLTQQKNLGWSKKLGGSKECDIQITGREKTGRIQIFFNTMEEWVLVSKHVKKK
jgi:hypothetical protein